MSNQTIAETILAQLGGKRFVFMTGAKHLFFGEKSLHFKAARHAFTIQLEPSDTYAVRMQSLRTGAVKRFTNRVYADQLCEIFESFSGLRVSL